MSSSAFPSHFHKGRYDYELQKYYAHSVGNCCIELTDTLSGSHKHTNAPSVSVYERTKYGRVSARRVCERVRDVCEWKAACRAGSDKVSRWAAAAPPIVPSRVRRLPTQAKRKPTGNQHNRKKFLPAPEWMNQQPSNIRHQPQKN